MDRLIDTADGSHSIYSEIFNATYHSTHGSVQESRTVFIEAGLQYFLNRGAKKVKILEIGFGTGLNAFMSYLASKQQPVDITYDSYELYPIEIEIAKNLNYPALLGAEIDRDVFISFHNKPGECVLIETSDRHHFNFKLFLDNFEECDFNSTYDLIYFDAFAPNVQPELWQEDFLKKMYDVLANDGILVTYCAQGAFKRALRAVGFSVEALPGPVGKREMTRASKKISSDA